MPRLGEGGLRVPNARLPFCTRVLRAAGEGVPGAQALACDPRAGGREGVVASLRRLYCARREGALMHRDGVWCYAMPSSLIMECIKS